MTKILFYVLQGEQFTARLRLVSKLVEKAHQQALVTHIHTQDAGMSEQLDEWLWNYSDLSFLPHYIVEQQPSDHSDHSRITISHTYEPTAQCDYLINLSMEQPNFFSRFKRLAEVIDQSEGSLHAGRKRYQFYRDRGYNLEYHQLR